MCDNEDLYIEAGVTQAYIQIIIGLLRVHINTGGKKTKNTIKTQDDMQVWK